MLMKADCSSETARPANRTRRKKGEDRHETDKGRAASAAQKTEGEGNRETDQEVAAICSQLQALQRVRVSFLKSRIMLDNRLVSSVAVAMGYRSGLEEAERKTAFDAARKTIKAITSSERPNETEGSLAPLVTEAMRSIAGFDKCGKFHHLAFGDLDELVEAGD